MESKELNIVQRIWLECLWQACRLFAMVPYWFKYHVVEEVLFFLLYYCLRYRRSVVDRNLRNSFPEKSEKELSIIRRKFYYTLSEQFVDILNMAHMGPQKACRSIIVKNQEAHRAMTRGQDWIAISAHFGSWEYCAYLGLYLREHILVSVYHPLRSVVMECLFHRFRNSDRAITVPMKDCLRYYLRNREKGVDGRNLVMGLLSDQNPPRRPNSHWFRFLNQDTIFFDGGEKLALRCHLPIYFAWMERRQRGRYAMTFEQIYDGEEPVAEYEITQRYVNKLEEMIRRQPELWLWSHRRWKHKRPDVDC